jgi:hypothetical protein
VQAPVGAHQPGDDAECVGHLQAGQGRRDDRQPVDLPDERRGDGGMHLQSGRRATSPTVGAHQVHPFVHAVDRHPLHGQRTVMAERQGAARPGRRLCITPPARSAWRSQVWRPSTPVPR